MHVGVIDADFKGQIMAMVSTATSPVTIKAGTRIAQLVPFRSFVPRTEPMIRGDRGFGSTGKPQVYWTQSIAEHHLEMTCILTMEGASPGHLKLVGLLDSGVDITIISLNHWPKSWPVVSNSEGVLGAGGVQHSLLAAKPVLISNPEGQKATIQPYVTSLPMNLWGRDLMQQWGVRLTMDFR